MIIRWACNLGHLDEPPENHQGEHIDHTGSNTYSSFLMFLSCFGHLRHLPFLYPSCKRKEESPWIPISLSTISLFLNTNTRTLSFRQRNNPFSSVFQTNLLYLSWPTKLPNFSFSFPLLPREFPALHSFLFFYNNPDSSLEWPTRLSHFSLAFIANQGSSRGHHMACPAGTVGAAIETT